MKCTSNDNEKSLKEKIERKWKQLNDIGIYTLEELHEYNKKTVINIGILGLTPEELQRELERRGRNHDY